MELTKSKLDELQEIARKLRVDVINMLVEAKSGHSAGPLGLADLFSSLYFHILKHNPKEPKWEERDRFFLSAGHLAPIRYAAMIESGYLSLDYLKTLRKLGSPLQGHPGLPEWEAVEASGGPLGQGISVAVGSAISAKMDKKDYWVYCLTSDGEQNEGQNWEAVMLAAKMKLDNLICFLDRNFIQISGVTEDIMPLEPLVAKYKAFNWEVKEIDGNNIEEIIKTADEMKKIKGKPKMIICKTVPGKGVDFMENNYLWHGKPPTEEEAKKALKQLSK